MHTSVAVDHHIRHAPGNIPLPRVRVSPEDQHGSPPDDPRQAMRQAMRTRRRQLGPIERIAAAQSLRDTLDTLPAFRSATRVAGYWACDGEIPLHSSLAMLARRGQAFHLPVIAGRTLAFAPWSPGEPVQANRFGIPEPASEQRIEAKALDLVLLPLLAFDRKGARLGTGGGFYDRCFAFLGDAQRPTRPLLVGVGYAFQEQSSMVMHAWDIPLDYVATEHQLIPCSNESMKRP